MTSTQELTYEGHVTLADGTIYSLQCFEDRCGECPDEVPDGQYSEDGPLQGYPCEHGCGHGPASQRQAPAHAEQVLTALGRAAGVVESIAGKHPAISLTVLGARVILGGPGPFTRDQVDIALSDAADEAAAICAPGEAGSSDGVAEIYTISGLVANLAAGWLDHPTRDADELIADRYSGLEPYLDDFQVWNTHVTDLDDHCPWSGKPVRPNREALMAGLEGDDESCPQGCHSAVWVDPERDTAAYNAAIAATVKGWIG